MALMFDYAPGMSLTDPWLWTVTRAQPAYRVTSAGTLVQVGANVLRDNHYVSGVRTTLFEPSMINSLLQSQTLGTTWSQTFSSVTSDQTAAPDGTVTADKLIEDSTASQAHYLQQNVTVTASEFVAFSCYAKASTGTRLLDLRYDTDSAANGFHVWYNLQTGAVGTATGFGTGTLSGSFIVPLANGWFWCGAWGKGGAGTTGRCTLVLANADNNEAYNGDGTSALFLWGAQLERNGTVFAQAPTSYMPTTTGVSSTRGADQMSTPWPFKIMPMWCYTSFYDRGACARTPTAFTVTITPNPAANPLWCAMFPGSAADVRSSWISDAGPGGVGAQNRNTAAATTVNPIFGDFVETFSQVFKDGSTTMAARRNGGAVTSVGPIGPSGTIPFADWPANPLLWLGFPGTAIATQMGITRVKIGADPTRIITLDQAASA